MTEEAFLADRPCEVRIRGVLVARSKIIRTTAGVVGDRRLEQMPTDIDQIPPGVASRTNNVIHLVFAALAGILSRLVITGRRRRHGDPRPLRVDDSLRF